MRQNIELVTGSNLANISDDNIESEIKFYDSFKKHSEETREILNALKIELLIRKFNVNCEKLNCYGKCNSEKIVKNLGNRECTEINGKMCLEKQIKLLEDL